MARTVLLLVASFAVQLAYAQDADATDTYVTADDTKVQDKAKLKSKELCKDIKSVTDWEPSRAQRKQDLKDNYIGKSNKLLEALKASDSSDEVGSNLQAETVRDMEWIVMQAFPLVCFFVSLIIYYCCCWTACPCCSCCRCCAKESSNPMVCKVIGLVLYSACVLAVVYMGSMALVGLAPVETGVNNMACTSAKFVNESLSGKDTPETKFIGFIPMLNIFQNLRDELKTGSDFYTNVGNIIDETMIIDDSVKVTSAMYKLLEDAIGAVPDTLAEISPSVPHRCTACAEIKTAISTAREILDGSVAQELVTVRSTVKEQLQGEGAESMSTMMNTAATPMVSLKDLMVSSLGEFLEMGLFENGATYIAEYGTLGVLALILLVLLVSSCGFVGCLSWVLCEKKSTDPDAPANPYNSLPSKCSCCTWCCSFPVLWIVCWIGGLLSIVVALTATLCDILDDFSGQMIEDISGPLPVNLSSMDQMGGMIDKCFNPPEINGERNWSANLLDLVNASHNMTMRDKFVVETKELIMGQFDALSSSMDTGGQGDMVDSDEVVSLREMLINEPIATWIIPDNAGANPSIQTMASSGESALSATNTLKTSLFCIEHTPSFLEDKLPIEGITPLDNWLQTQAPTTYDDAKCPGGDCSGNSLADGTGCGNGGCYFDCIRPTTCTGAVCDAVNTYLEAKAKLVEAKKYRCDVFEKDDGSDCDPLDEQDPTNCCQGGSSAGQSGRSKDIPCTLKVKTKLCGMKEFTQYVRRFGVNAPTTLNVAINLQPGNVNTKTGRVAECMKDMVAKQEASLDKINTDLRAEVKGTFLDKIDEFADGAGCGFLGQLYREMIDGLCYAGCWGLGTIAQAYVGSIFCILVMILLAYILWRRVYDNREQWKKKQKKALKGGT